MNDKDYINCKVILLMKKEDSYKRIKDMYRSKKINYKNFITIWINIEYKACSYLTAIRLI